MVTEKAIKTTAPGYRLSLYERETIILFNEEEQAATVETFNPALIRKLDALTEQRAGEMELQTAESINGVSRRVYVIPKKWVKVQAARILSDTEKQRLSERGKELAARRHF